MRESNLIIGKGKKKWKNWFFTFFCLASEKRLNMKDFSRDLLTLFKKNEDKTWWISYKFCHLRWKCNLYWETPLLHSISSNTLFQFKQILYFYPTPNTLFIPLLNVVSVLDPLFNFCFLTAETFLCGHHMMANDYTFPFMHNCSAVVWPDIDHLIPLFHGLILQLWSSLTFYLFC